MFHRGQNQDCGDHIDRTGRRGTDLNGDICILFQFKVVLMLGSCVVFLYVLLVHRAMVVCP